MILLSTIGLVVNISDVVEFWQSTALHDDLPDELTRGLVKVSSLMNAFFAFLTHEPKER